MTTLRIFISSPGDVGREREVACRIVERVEARFAERVKLEMGYEPTAPVAIREIPEPTSTS